MSDIRPLMDIPTGSVVMLMTARPWDLAYMQTGVVLREETEDGSMSGILWDGSRRLAIAYPAETRFAVYRVGEKKD